jgi:shikimate 5-dehydrogenase
VAELTSEPRWAFEAGVGNGNASVLSRVDEPSTLTIELIYWPATTFAAKAEAQAALFRYIDGWCMRAW